MRGTSRPVPEALLIDIVGRADRDSLLETMLDMDIAPIYLEQYADSDSRLTGVLARVLPKIQTYLQTLTPSEISDLCDDYAIHFRPLECEILRLGMNASFFNIPTELFSSPQSDSKVLSQFPELSKRVDDDGLLFLDDLSATSEAVYYKDQVLQYHHFLRRGFIGNINSPLIAAVLWASDQVPGNCVRIAIDPRRLVSPEEFGPSTERDFWFGPQVSVDMLNNMNPGSFAPVSYRHPEPHHEPYDALLALWKRGDEHQKVVEIEELVPPSRFRDLTDLRMMRYLHAIWDVRNGVFTHCDGAVRAYSATEYLIRYKEGKLPPARKAMHYRKVFRLDGEISVDAWSSIVARWYRHNTLVREFLGDLSETENLADSASAPRVPYMYRLST